MPAVLPFLPLIIAGATTGTEVGMKLAGVGEPSAPKPQTPEAPKPPDQTQEKEALMTAAPSVQERLGGAVAPDFFASEVARVSGSPQDAELAKQVLSQFMGLGGTPDKQGISMGVPSQGGGGQTFNPLTVSSSSGSPAMPNFFEGLMGGQGSGGSGQNEFSGGFQ